MNWIEANGNGSFFLSILCKLVGIFGYVDLALNLLCDFFDLVFYSIIFLFNWTYVENIAHALLLMMEKLDSLSLCPLLNIVSIHSIPTSATRKPRFLRPQWRTSTSFRRRMHQPMEDCLLSVFDLIFHAKYDLKDSIVHNHDIPCSYLRPPSMNIVWNHLALVTMACVGCCIWVLEVGYLAGRGWCWLNLMYCVVVLV